MNQPHRGRGFRAALIGAMLVVAGVGLSQYLETTIPVGDSPSEVLWNPTSNKVYVSNSQDWTVTIIDGATNSVIATLDVPELPGWLCWNSRENKVYVMCGEADRVAVIDGVGDTVIGTVTVAGYPCYAVYNATMNKLYITCNDDPIYRVTVLDAGADTVVTYIDMRGVGALAWHPVSNRVFSYSDWDADTVKVIDCATDEVVSRVAIANGGHGMGGWCFNPLNGLMYLAGRHAVYAFAPDGNTVAATVPGWAFDMTFAPFANKLYVSDVPGLRVIDCGSHAVLETVPAVGAWLLCDTQKAKVYSTNYSPGVVFVVDARADTLTKSIPLGRYPSSLCWNETNSRVYIADFMDNVVYVIRDTSAGVEEAAPAVAGGRRLTRTIQTGGALRYDGPDGARLLDTGGRVVLTVRPGDNNVSALPPGVYYVNSLGAGATPAVPQKVIITR